MKVIVRIDGSKIKTEADFHEQLGDQLALPYYGRNIHALWDTLSVGIERPLSLVWSASSISRSRLGAKFDLILQVLERVKSQDERFGWDDCFTYSLE